MKLYRLPWWAVFSGMAWFTAMGVWGSVSSVAQAGEISTAVDQVSPPISSTIVPPAPSSGSSLAVDATVTTPALPAEMPRRPLPDPMVERLIRRMSVHDKVGQLLMVGFAGTEINPSIERWITQRRVGGVALFSRNIVDRQQTTRLTHDLQALTRKGIPIFIALDQEGGQVVRVKDGATLLPGNMALGATRNPNLAYAAGQALAIDLRLLGFNMNFAPVLDVNSNPRNPVIGIRSYGERPDLVGLMGSWYLRGQQEMGVIGVAKHFPGHGDTQTDSHFAMPVVQMDAQRLQETALAPFRQAMQAGLDAVMTAHIALPRIAGSGNLPATVSKPILTGLLRKKMGFDGIVMTDGLEMQGIAKRTGVGRAAVAAILAGADMPMIVWSPQQKEEVYRTLLHAVKRGEISRERLNRSVRRILTVKAKHAMLGASKGEHVPTISRMRHNAPARRTDNPVHSQVAEQIARQAITLVRNQDNVLPLVAERYRNVVVIAPLGKLAMRLKQEPFLRVFTMPVRMDRAQRNAIAREAAQKAVGADAIVIVAANGYHVEIARMVTRMIPRTPSVLVSMASPYYLANVPQADAYVCSYSAMDSAQIALADALLGHAPMTGHLPVSIPGLYAYDHRWVAEVAPNVQDPGTYRPANIAIMSTQRLE